MKGADTMDERCRTWQVVLWILMCSSWIAQGLSRAQVNPDGVSYLDIASAALKGHWGALINAYWSPLYPAVLCFWLFLFRPSIYWEARTARFLNCVTLVIALWCFEYLVSGLVDYQETTHTTEQESAPIPAWALRAIGYMLFFFASVYMTPANLVTPDALVMALVLVAAGIIIRIRCGTAGTLSFAALGLVLGLAYLAKAAMFPVGLVFLLAVLFAVRNVGRTIPRILLAVFFFVVVSGPFIFALSQSKARLTFGDSGAINYAQYVNGATRAIHWQGQPPGTGTPKHPTRRIFETPPVYEYAEPVGGSYPPWTDPSYWYDGIRPHFALRDQLKTLHNSVATYYDLFNLVSVLFAGFLVFLFWGDDIHGFANNFLKGIFLWAPAVAALGMYSLVHVELRFVSGFIVLVWAAAFVALRIPERAHVIVRSVTLTIVLLLGLQIILSFKRGIVIDPSHGMVSTACEIAQDLRLEGVKPGDRVAFIGPAAWDHYWAHLAQVSVVSEVGSEGAKTFWAVSPQLRSKVTTLLAQTGVRAVVARDVPAELLADGWKEVSHTDYYVLMLRR